MKFGLTTLFSLLFLAFSSAQDPGPAKSLAPPPVGLEVGLKAPAFSSTDQFGHEQTNETLKGSGGTIVLFFRSADW